MSRLKHRRIPELTDKQLRNFWCKVDRRGPDECWPWLAGKVKGYGMFRLRPVGSFIVTRIMYYLTTGKQPGPLCACHKCDKPGCCNPAHLFLGTLADNVADRDAKGRGCINRVEGVDTWNVKLTEEQVLEIRASGETQYALADKYGLGQPTISKIRSRKAWKHI